MRKIGGCGQFSKTRQYLETMVILLLMAVPFHFIVNCSFSKYMKRADQRPGTLGAHFRHNETDKAADMAETVQIGLALERLGDEDTAEVAWTPPEGAAGFQFTGMQPSNPGGPAPFLYSSVPAHNGTPSEADIQLTYQPPAVGGGYTFIDTVLATTDNERVEGFCLSHRAGAKASPAAALNQFVSAQRAKIQNDVSAWRFKEWLYQSVGVQDLPLSEAETLVEYLLSGSFFVGLRFPVTQEVDVLSYRLPVGMEAEDVPVLAILDHNLPWSGDDLNQAVARLPLEYVPSRNEWLHNHLPVQSATRWAALAPKQAPVTLLEDRFPIEAGRWELFTTGVVNLGHMPNSCENCILEVYMCHEGSGPPPFFESGFKAVAGVFKTYQGDGVTCFGPLPVRLVDSWGGIPSDFDPPILLRGQGLSRVTPPGQVQFHHTLETSGSETISLTVESSRGRQWGFYEGDYEQPDLGRPITGNITVQGFTNVWLVADIPADAPAGSETVLLSASRTAEPSKKVWATDVLWVGDWVAPPGGESRFWIPVASHAPGAQGSAWRTDLGLLNTGTGSVDAIVTLHGAQGPVSLNQTVPAGEQLILSDVVDQMGFTGSGALEVTASGPLVVTSRTYSQVGPTDQCYPDGTLGQSLGATASGAGLAAGQSAVVPQLQENAAFRSNVAVINTGSAEAEVRVHLLDGHGTELTSYDVTLAPGQWEQENGPFADFADQTDMAAGYARIEVLSGSGIVAYGSVVDNITNDPTTMAVVR
ncbi:MAG: hypothetical protein K8R59_04680 [Thermoanaerobaculales bacterium]|nr:hypothetical protein [Thermoanaerobaculales bacterium]